MWQRIVLQLACSLVVIAAGLPVGSRAAKSHARVVRPVASGGGVVTLTDLNFDELISNGKPWMINVFSHYCQLTHELEDSFEQLAHQVHPDISVGRVDGTIAHGLLSRFQLRGYHAVYHVNGTETRQYCDGHACEGARSSPKQLANFARDGWQAVKPRTGCGSPVSRCGRAVGEVTKLPARMKDAYIFLRNERHYSDLTLFAGLLAVPVALGLSFICMLDVYYSRKPLPLPPQAHPHHD